MLFSPQVKHSKFFTFVTVKPVQSVPSGLGMHFGVSFYNLTRALGREYRHVHYSFCGTKVVECR